MMDDRMFRGLLFCLAVVSTAAIPPNPFGFDYYNVCLMHGGQCGAGCAPGFEPHPQYTCGFSGGTCCTLSDAPCSTNPCGGNAVCTETPGSFTCTCPAGFTQDPITGLCTNSPCSSNPCGTNQVCTDNGNTFTCTCSPAAGFIQDPITGVCIDVNECLTNNGGCASIATCTNTGGSFFCTCPAGYTSNGLTCNDINECATNNGGCASIATCTNTGGSFFCTCPAGYTTNGLTCNDLNECATNNGGCASIAVCTNMIGSFVCTCPAGYTTNGLACNDINECLTNPCTLPEICTNSIGSFTCSEPCGVPITSRMINANTGVTGEHPWFVRILTDSATPFQTCGGILINENWVIVDALCGRYCELFQSDCKAVVGDYSTILGDDSTEQERTITQMFYHDNTTFNSVAELSSVTPRSDTLKYNVGLMRLSSPVLSAIGANYPCAPKNLPSGTNCVVVGTGMTDRNSFVFATQRGYKDVTLMPDTACTSRTVPIVDANRCAQLDGAASAVCFGDNGGPVVCQGVDNSWSVEGVISVYASDPNEASQCSGQYFPYTDLNQVWGWIQTTMQNNP